MIKEIYLRWFGITVIGLLFPLIIKFGDEMGSNYWRSACFSTFYTTLCWNGCVWINTYFDKRFIHYEQTAKRIFYIFLTTTLYFIFINAFISVMVDTYIFQHNFQTRNYLRITLLAVLLGAGINSMYEMAFFWQLLKEKIKEAERLKTENIQSQFEVLKNQVNPHFLFNSLNTLITIIPENPTLAVQFAEKLSSVYRYILQNKDKELVSLQTELDFAKAYIFMLKIRFGENFKVKINIPEQHLQDAIPPLTLQMLIENAIKHNVVSTEKPLTLEMYVDKVGVLLVRNNFQKKKVTEQSTQLGLENIKNRYKYLTDKQVDVIVTQANFEVALPLIHLNKEEYESVNY